MRTSLTIYLFKKRFKTTADAIAACKLDGYTLYQSMGIDFEAKCYAKSNYTGAPKWVSFYQGNIEFPPGMFENRSSSLVAYLKVSSRVFAVTEGAGFHCIPRDLVEGDFGLRACLNSIGENALRSLQTRNLDPLTVQRLEVSNQQTSLRSFALDQRRDLLSRIEGVPEDDSHGITASGGDSLRLHIDTTFSHIGDVCSNMLKLSRKKKYQKNFKFIDQVRRVTDSGDVSELDSRLEAQLSQPAQHPCLGLALPKIDRYGEVSWYVAKLVHEVLAESGDLSDGSILQAVSEVEKTDDLLRSVRISAEDGDSARVESGVLRDWIVTEVDWGQKKYILSAGSWYSVHADYVDEINARVSSVDVIRARGYLPSIKKNNSTGEVESEGSYNERCATRRRLCLDQQNIQMERWGAVEPCDLFSSDKHIIHVKKQSSSATLSHLWSQGVVSGQLMIEDREYRKKLRRKLGSMSRLVPLQSVNPSDYTIVYAIATEHDGFPLRLPFFSKVNMLYNINNLKLMGYCVKMRKIDYEHDGGFVVA